MGESGLDKQVAVIVDQLAEQFNLAISVAVDEKRTFEQGESIFREAVAVLDYYSCGEIAAEQMVNFSKVAFFRKQYDKALYYAVEAADRGRQSAADNLHAMAFRLFELVLVESSETIRGVDFEDLQDVLVPEDYCRALQNVYRAARQTKTEEGRQFLAGVLKKLTHEVTRQGLRREKNGDVHGALLLQKTVLPFLNPKRAAVIAAEIKKLEENISE